VAPHADPAQIRLRYRGATDLRLDAQGNLIYTTELGDLTETAPIAWQETEGKRTLVETRFRIEGDTVSFQVAAYNPDHPLVIDPTLVYSGFLGGSGIDRGYGIAVDGAGNAYVTGSSDGGFPQWYPDDCSAPNPFCYFSPALPAAFIAKINVTGTALVYSSYLGGAEFGYGIAVDGAGNAYVTGVIGHPGLPVVNCGWSGCAAQNGYFDAFVAKINAAGTALVYSGYLSGSAWNEGRGIAADSAGNAYVTGFTVDPTTNPGAPLVNFPVANCGWTGCTAHNDGYRDAFITKINADGSALVYSGFLGGSDQEEAHGITIDVDGNAYVTGFTASADFPVANCGWAGCTAVNGYSDAFITKVNAAGSALVYSGFLGGSGLGGAEEGHGIAVDSAGNAYVTGYTSSADFPVVGSLSNYAGFTTYGGNNRRDAFITKINAAGSALVYSGFLGGGRHDVGHGIAVDTAGNAYVTGYTDDDTTDFPAVGALSNFAGFTTHNGGTDAFIAQVNAAGNALVYSGFLGGTGYDEGLAIAVDGAGNVYVTGETVHAADGFPVQGTSAIPGFTDYYGGSDAFVAKIAPVFASADITPSLDFGPQLFNTTSAARIATVTNTGANPVSILAIAHGGADPGDFGFPAAGSTCIAGSTVLLAGESCQLHAPCRPRTLGLSRCRDHRRFPQRHVVRHRCRQWPDRDARSAGARIRPGRSGRHGRPAHDHAHQHRQRGACDLGHCGRGAFQPHARLPGFAQSRGVLRD